MTETNPLIEKWLNGNFDLTTKEEIQRLQKEDRSLLEDAFNGRLKFGTAGMRGIMGAGTNRINRYTIRAASLGLANHLKKNASNKALKVVIGFDTRHQSKAFALETARVLAQAGIEAYLFQKPFPLCLVSFAIRLLHCDAGVMITASHNPPEFNGFKVYWKEGSQVLPPHDIGIVKEVEAIDDFGSIAIAEENDPKIHLLSDEIKSQYIQTICSSALLKEQNQKEGRKLQIVYTPLHGAGFFLLPDALKEAGFSNVKLIEEQTTFDGSFPTVHSPNPEEKEAMQLGLDAIQKANADLLIGTDPDTDRLGVAVMHNQTPHLLNGNQIACLLLHHLLKTRAEQKTLPAKSATLKSIVTTELFKAISNSFNATCIDLLTGFKYIGEKINEWDINHEYEFIFGAEESYGFLTNPLVRDKDAVSAACVVAELALKAKLMGKTLIDELESLYRQYGFYHEEVRSLSLKNTSEITKVEKMMKSFSENPPTSFAKEPVLFFEDFQTGNRRNLKTQEITSLNLPASPVIIFKMEDGTKLAIRPSGTEPKVKFYCGVVEKETSSVEALTKKAKKRLDAMLEELFRYVQ